MTFEEAYKRLKEAYASYYSRRYKRFNDSKVEIEIGERLASLSQGFGEEWNDEEAKRYVETLESKPRE